MQSGMILQGRYQIDKIVSRGGMGAIYRALEPGGQPVAIKVLHNDENQSAERFFHEISILESLRHPAVVRYLDSGLLDDGAPFLAMEWLEGQDLARSLRHTWFSIDDTLGWAVALARALAAVHELGIVHRDLKPANIFLEHGCARSAKLIDFGIALLAGASTRITAAGRLIHRALEDLMAAVLSSRPLVLVLEDLHWSDRGTIAFIHRALRTLASAPLCIVAMGRPELHDRFARLWADRNMVDIRLGPLRPRDAEELVRAALGPESGRDITGAQVGTLVERAGGNPLFLEELLRNAASGDWDSPPSVLAVMSARLERLDARARQVLRAASVFGSAFWQSGVNVLVGAEVAPADWLEHLVEQELIAVAPVSRFPGEGEYRFCHDLVREAAYDMLTCGDRRLGHQLAGEWLGRAGESDLAVLAEHFERGGDSARALEHYPRAAEDALARSALATAHNLAERGLACGAEGEALGRLERVLGHVEIWRGKTADVARWLSAAMEHLPAGTYGWYEAAGEAGLALLKLGQVERAQALLERLRAPGVERSASDDERIMRLVSLAKLGVGHATMGNHELGTALIAELEVLVSGESDPALMAEMHFVRGCYQGESLGNWALLRTEVESAVACFAQVGDHRRACFELANMGYASLMLGLYEEAAGVLAAASEEAERMGLDLAAHSASRELGIALRRGAPARATEADELLFAAERWFSGYGDLLRAAECSMELADMRLAAGELDQAEHLVRAALAVLERSGTPLYHARPLAQMSRVFLARGQDAQALELAEQGWSILQSSHAGQADAAYVRLSYAEALHGTGKREQALEVIRDARERLLTSADAIHVPAWRDSYLGRVAVHARTLRLADEWDRADGMS